MPSGELWGSRGFMVSLVLSVVTFPLSPASIFPLLFLFFEWWWWGLLFWFTKQVDCVHPDRFLTQVRACTEWALPSTCVSVCVCVCVCFSLVWLPATLWTIAHKAPLVHGILHAGKLEWLAMPSSRGSSRPRDWTSVPYVSCMGRWVLYY